MVKDELLAELTSGLMFSSVQCLPPLPPIAKDKYKQTWENNLNTNMGEQPKVTAQGNTEYLSIGYKRFQVRGQRSVLHSEKHF